MTAFIALYRGINVGGKHPVKMQALRALHQQLGHQHVTTYIQSGNVVFSATGAAQANSPRITKAFAAQFGFAAHVIVLDAKRWLKLAQENPYENAARLNPRTVHLGVCTEKPNAHALRLLLAKTGGTEAFEIRSNLLYVHAPDGFGTSKFAAGMEKASGVPMTVRNWRTVEALSALTNSRPK